MLWLLVITTVSCNSPDPIADKASNDQSYMGLQALLWTQYAAETEALYLQGYNIATDRILEYTFESGVQPPAVVLDIDETVLDNSPFNVELLRLGTGYSDEKWNEWCERREALPLPGALSFTRLADSLGIEVFYVSNRHESMLEATLDNLEEYNFPYADKDHVLLKSTTSSKDQRRETIEKDFEIILLLGDNLGDFNGIFDNRTIAQGKQAMRDHRESFGRRFIVFPNPIYGSWIRGVFPDGMPSESQVLDVLRGYEDKQ